MMVEALAAVLTVHLIRHITNPTGGPRSERRSNSSCQSAISSIPNKSDRSRTTPSWSSVPRNWNC
jgi:hypothetical protein